MYGQEKYMLKYSIKQTVHNILTAVYIYMTEHVVRCEYVYKHGDAYDKSVNTSLIMIESILTTQRRCIITYLACQIVIWVCPSM